MPHTGLEPVCAAQTVTANSCWLGGRASYLGVFGRKKPQRYAYADAVDNAAEGF